MRVKFPVVLIVAVALTFGLCASVFADTIRLRDGSVVRGQIIGFKDGQFIILIGTGARNGRRSRMTVYVEDVESIDFDNANGNAIAGNDANTPSNPSGAADTSSTAPPNSARAEDAYARPSPSSAPSSTGVYDSAASRRQPSSASTNETASNRSETMSGGSSSNGVSSTSNGSASSASAASDTSVMATSAAGTYFPVSLRVRADNAPSGWTSSGIVVRRGQRLRITASGRVMLAGGQASTPAGVPRLPDKDKLMRDEATGALIAVIGDDNDDFIYIGNRREFTAQRDGVLFLGVNSGTLAQNSGAYDVTVEAEALSTSKR
jgi:hypothetical protein